MITLKKTKITNHTIYFPINQALENKIEKKLLKTNIPETKKAFYVGR